MTQIPFKPKAVAYPDYKHSGVQTDANGDYHISAWISKKEAKASIDEVLDKNPLKLEDAILFVGHDGYNLIYPELKDNYYRGVLVERRDEIQNYICYLTHRDNVPPSAYL